MKSPNKGADIGTKTLAAGTVSFLRSVNGLVGKSAMHQVSRALPVATISTGESRKQRAAALLVLEEALDEIVRHDERDVTE